MYYKPHILKLSGRDYSYIKKKKKKKKKKKHKPKFLSLTNVVEYNMTNCIIHVIFILD
ncbi:hypothetical protein HanRHA438_Chr01g0046841 [Helianthus annuus]|nr:hypothetical protein HanRHA438_Chr01g0046841 [Helianthus annuus]